ncbi:alkaline phosphatase [Polaribacter reichenbachii]|uniref:Alkaline phosphatase n=1 Tax=Polaribacter reichenbachii TaxID=996801 RepID=A0A1B8U4B0_9FLAO|nr:alkaline phosphatase [Polaribacter reichenbachii]APZ47447.1 alkaline phosphatase [Polaribacter reichenbachii]AUC18086.1 alkaline phosphatase [Polaribacter reichenbachii]OBY66697.1 alkaline phosphatase [Polaribacter reichenbachii]
MNRFTKTILLSLVAMCYIGCENKSVQNTPKEPLNVIFMVGDGMGLSQISTAFYFGEDTPNFEQFQDIGFIKTPSTSHTITDSAAGATAFSTGQKTYKRAIGMSKDSLPIPTIIETLQKEGYTSGLVSLTPITHATPGAFYAHVKDRDLHEDIALDLVKSNIDFFAGGGLKYLKHRSDQKDLYAELITKNYKLDSVELSKYDINKKNGYLLAHEGLPSKLEGRKRFFQDATQLALNYLTEKEKPFFLMLEGSYIDWGGHAMDAELLKQEVLDFDKTLGVVLKYIKKHPNTLLVVTADHETGGVSIGKSYVVDEATGERSEEVDNVSINFNNDQHSGTLIPVFAKGKGSAHFRGIYENNEIYHKILKAIHHK